MYSRIFFYSSQLSRVLLVSVHGEAFHMNGDRSCSGGSKALSLYKESICSQTTPSINDPIFVILSPSNLVLR